MIASTSAALNTKIGMSGWPETIPSASDVLDGIAARQGLERRRFGMQAVAGRANGMTTRTVFAQ